MKNMTRLRLNDVKSINNLIARTINSLLDETISEEEARVIGYLANILYKGIEQVDKLEMDKKYQEAQIENLIARTNNINYAGAEVEDLEGVYKEIYGDYKSLEVIK